MRVEGGSEGGVGEGEVKDLSPQGGVVPWQPSLSHAQIRHGKPAEKEVSQQLNDIRSMYRKRLILMCLVNNHTYSTLFETQERESDRRNEEIEQRKESQKTHV